jgi:membrane protein implicated in regulation of membrane protease activity
MMMQKIKALFRNDMDTWEMITFMLLIVVTNTIVFAVFDTHSVWLDTLIFVPLAVVALILSRPLARVARRTVGGQ